MTDKSLGQVAFEAYVAAYGEQLDHREWPTNARRAWQAAAEAVMHQVVRGVQWDYMPPQVRAVIEAAKEQNAAHDAWADVESRMSKSEQHVSIVRNQYRAACLRTNRTARGLEAVEKGE